MDKFRNIGLCSFLCFFVITGCTNTNNAATSTMVNPAVSSTHIDEALTTLMSSAGIPGIAVGLVSLRSGEPVYWTKGYGTSNVDNVEPVTENTSFWMASVSKAVLGTVMMMGVEQQLYTLDQDIRPLLLENTGLTIGDPQDREISLRDLATHTSGILDADAYACSYYTINQDNTTGSLSNLLDFGVDCPESGPIDLGDYLNAYLDPNGEFYSAEDHFSTESESDYSNVGAALAGYFIGLSANQSLEAYAQSKLFAPLGMNDTFWNQSGASNVQITSQHYIDDEVIALPRYELATYPDGGLRSSVHDMTRFLGFIMNDGVYEEISMLQATSIQEMHTVGELNDEYGLFWEIEDKTGHTGSDPGATTIAMFDPDTSTGIVILTNADDDNIDDSEADELLDLLFDSAMLLD